MSRRALALLCVVALAAAPASAAEVVAPATRDVTPPDMTPGPTVDGPLIRVPTPPRPPDPPRWHRYFLPVTTDAATFAVDGLAVHIAGVTPPAADETCAGVDGAPWPCGRTALYAFRRFLHGRAVECYFPYTPAPADITAPCRVGTTDLALWLLSQGWAEPSALATDAYRAAAETARCNNLGIWRATDKPQSCPTG